MSEETQTSYVFIYGSLPPAGVPVAIDSTAQDAEDPAIEAAIEVGPWEPYGPVILIESGVGPVPKMCWGRRLVLPAGFLQKSTRPAGAPAKPRLVETVPPGTRVEDLLRR